ncbi:MAG TPA: hypothetical protein VGN17_27105 [Bryobacteraceae bacterium]|jgi:hypothetical protein
MRSPKQVEASRTNGARSQGPVTPQGKFNSAHNATTHALLSSTIVLEDEDEDRFQALLAGLIEEFQPATQAQMVLVETMAAARWRQLRVWGAQKTALDRDIALQDPATGPASVRVLFALRGSAETACPPELLLRYDVSFNNQFNRALNNLLTLKARRTPSQSVPYFPIPASGHTWKDTPIANRTQEAPENNDPHQQQ